MGYRKSHESVWPGTECWRKKGVRGHPQEGVAHYGVLKSSVSSSLSHGKSQCKMSEPKWGEEGFCLRML